MTITTYELERLLKRVEHGTTTARDAELLRRLLHAPQHTAAVCEG